MNEERFIWLVERHLEDLLSEEEARELLEAPEPFRSRLLDEVTLAGLLARVNGAAPADLPSRIQAALRGPDDKERMVAQVLEHLPSRRGGFRRFLLLAAAALAVAALIPFVLQKARSIPPAALSPEARTAVERGVQYLRSAELPRAAWSGPLPSDELVLFTLLNSGVKPEDPFFDKLLKQVLSAELQRVYSVSLQAVVLERLDPARYRDRIAECGRFLVESQYANGQWSYGKPVAEAPGRRLDPAFKHGNNSCSAFAVLGLRACSESGFKVPRETLERAAGWWRESQHQEESLAPGQERGGWCYRRHEKNHRPYASMTACGVTSIVLLDDMMGQDWRKDPVVTAGVNWLTRYFTVMENFGPVEDLMVKEMESDSVNPMTEFYFYLWALERAGGVMGARTFGTHDWHAEGVSEILAAQRSDGSWYGGARRCQPVWDTCFAILFLTRSTRPVAN